MKAALLALAILALPLSLRAQDSGSGKKTEAAPPTAEQLAQKQKELRKRLDSLEETMRRIAKILAKTDPDKAARLEMAWRRSREDGNLKKVADIEAFLRQQYFQQALNQQKDLSKALEAILDILLDKDQDRKQLTSRIQHIKDLAERLKSIEEQETNHFHESEKYADPEGTLQRAAAAGAQVDELIRRQSKLLDRTNSPAERSGLEALKERVEKLAKAQASLHGDSGAASQQQLAAQAEALAKDLDAYAKSLPKSARTEEAGRKDAAGQAAAAGARAAADMKDAAARMARGADSADPRRHANEDLREAKEALDRLANRLKEADRADLAKRQERLRADTKRLQGDLEDLQKSAPGSDSGAGDLSKAQGSMQDAEHSLKSGDRKGAVPGEQKAVNALKKAKEKIEGLSKELKRLLKLPDYDKLAEKQDATEKQTKDLLKKMGANPQAGPQPDGSQQASPAPGSDQVEGARKAMQRASRNLRSHSAKSANSDQKEALDRLKKARQQLEEALRQLREEQRLMLLDTLERRFTRMLAKQEQMFKETVALDLRIKDAGKPTPEDEASATKLGTGEADLSADAGKVLEILKEEGSTVVIPDVVSDLSADFESLAGRLRRIDAGSYTQEVQEDCIATLKELLQVVQEEKRRRQGGGSGGAPGSQSEDTPPDNLLPASAELKMLREMQMLVNRRTERFDRLKMKDAAERKRLASRQAEVADRTKAMADALNKKEGE